MPLKLQSSSNLQPIRSQLIELVPANSSVIEFGCGNGELLLQLASKINYGLGIDNSKASMDVALKQKQQYGLSNIDFLCHDLNTSYKPDSHYDVGIASLFFHVIPHADAVHLLQQLKTISKTVFICGFCKPQTFSQKIILWADQKMTSHYKNFKMYQQNGYMQGLLEKVDCKNFEVFDTSISFLKIYKIN